MTFEQLPVDLCRGPDGKEKHTVADLLRIWDIDNPADTCIMAQVLRHLREAYRKLEDSHE